MLSQTFPATLSREERQTLESLLGDYPAMYPKDPPDQIRMLQLMILLRAANKLPQGDYIELGVHRGLTLKLIHRCMDQTRTLCAFDTFIGFDARDIEAENNPRWRVGNFKLTSVAEVAEYLGRPRNVQFYQGWFPETFDGEHLGNSWRFAHLDMDLRRPTEAALRLLWPDMVPGGIIALHDYGAPGFKVNEVVDKFCAEIGVLPIELPDRWTTAVIRKPVQ